MYRKNVEFGVGIFVLAGILALAYLSINLGGLEIFDDGTYEVSANFTTATGLRKGASVEMAGVRVGRVSGISLDGEDAKISLRINEHLKLSRDSIASIRTKGVLGDKYVSLSQGGAEKIIPPGGRIRETEPPVDIEKLIGDFVFGKVKK